ncbi:hypothetical protein PLUTE_b6003 [Pseudoalteromonas luteoviolacea DSM 6061]|nr:hypothetical protein [Pseudoalteromonas luteoviolacea DSM 6061]
MSNIFLAKQLSGDVQGLVDTHFSLIIAKLNTLHIMVT